MSGLVFDADTLTEEALEKFTNAMSEFAFKGKTDAEYYRAQAEAAHAAGWLDGELPKTARALQAIGRQVSAIYKDVMGLDPKA